MSVLTLTTLAVGLQGLASKQAEAHQDTYPAAETVENGKGEGIFIHTSSSGCGVKTLFPSSHSFSISPTQLFLSWIPQLTGMGVMAEHGAAFYAKLAYDILECSEFAKASGPKIFCKNPVFSSNIY